MGPHRQQGQSVPSPGVARSPVRPMGQARGAPREDARLSQRAGHTQSLSVTRRTPAQTLRPSQPRLAAPMSPPLCLARRSPQEAGRPPSTCYVACELRRRGTWAARPTPACALKPGLAPAASSESRPPAASPCAPARSGRSCKTPDHGPPGGPGGPRKRDRELPGEADGAGPLGPRGGSAPRGLGPVLASEAAECAS